VRDPDRDTEVSRRRSSQEQSVHSIGTLAREGEKQPGAARTGNETGEGLNGPLPEGKGKWECE
jgi:hypothetical protein